MTPDDTLERHLVESMASVAASGSPDYLDDILGRSSRTRQRRAWPLQRSVFPARAPLERAGWRTGRSYMTPIIGSAAIAAVALAVGVVIGPFGSSNQHGVLDPSPTASPSTSPAPLPAEGSLAPATYAVRPFAAPGSDACGDPSDPICDEAIPDDTIGITFTVPDGWSGNGGDGIELATGFGQTLDGAAMIFVRGASPYNDPCDHDSGRIPVGPTAADFADALDGHPLLDVTAPVDTSVGGYPGKYLELQVPDDPTIQGSGDPAEVAGLEGCPVYRPWEPWYLARMGGERWLLWIVDVGAHRVVVQAMVHPETTQEVEEQLRQIVASIEFEPATAPVASPSPAPLTVRGWPGTRAGPAGVYSWRPGTAASCPPCTRNRAYMHHGGAEIWFGTWSGLDAPSALRSSWDQRLTTMAALVTAAGYDDRSFPEGPVRVPDDRPMASAGSRTQLWLLDVDGTRFFMLIEATARTSAADEAEAEEVVRSVRVGPPSLGPGIVLTFELPPGWDSG